MRVSTPPTPLGFLEESFGVERLGANGYGAGSVQELVSPSHGRASIMSMTSSRW